MHESTDSLYLRTRILIGRKLLGDFGPSVTKFSRKTVLKGPCEASELEALQFVAQNTSIPIPKVRSTYHRVDGLYVEMDYIKGETLNTAWKQLSPDQKKKVIKELAGFMKQLRDLQPPQPECVASAKLGGTIDYRIGTSSVGPYQSHEAFHSYLRGGIPLGDCTKVFGEVVTHCHSKQYQTRFCHADLAPRNIIIQGDRIAAIVDWQFAGWYPEYWEYTKAYYSLYFMSDWYAELREAIGSYDEELKAERALWAQFGEPGLSEEWIAEFAKNRKAEA